MRFYAIEKLVHLQDGLRKLVKIDHHNLLLICEGGQRVLVENYCPHMGHALQAGTVENGVLRCPAHGFEFDLRTGRCVSANCKPLRLYPLVYEGNEVGVML